MGHQRMWRCAPRQLLTERRRPREDGAPKITPSGSNSTQFTPAGIGFHPSDSAPREGVPRMCVCVCHDEFQIMGDSALKNDSRKQQKHMAQMLVDDIAVQSKAKRGGPSAHGFMARPV